MREGGLFLIGGAAALATCCGEGGLEAVFALLGEPEPQAA